MAVGYDANREEFVDMFQAGIIDPAKVSRVASAECFKYCRVDVDY